MAQWHTQNKNFFTADGVIHETKITSDRNGNLINTFGGSANLHLSAGLIEGHSIVNIFGYSSAISPNKGFVPAWEVEDTSGDCIPYVYPTEPIPMEVVSNSLDAGYVLRIIGLDGDYNVITQDITLDATGSQFTQNFFRINKILTIQTNGINGGNPANDVIFRNGGITYARMRGGEGQNQASIYTVPTNHCLFLTRIDAFSATASNDTKYLTFRNFVKLPTGVTYRVAETTFVRNMSVMRQAPFCYEEKTDIQLQVVSSSGDQEVGLFAEGVLVNKDYL
jgi:hypothetical protein